MLGSLGSGNTNGTSHSPYSEAVHIRVYGFSQIEEYTWGVRASGNLGLVLSVVKSVWCC